jgi:hypothetical protein
MTKDLMSKFLNDRIFFHLKDLLLYVKVHEHEFLSDFAVWVKKCREQI